MNKNPSAIDAVELRKWYAYIDTNQHKTVAQIKRDIDGLSVYFSGMVYPYRLQKYYKTQAYSVPIMKDGKLVAWCAKQRPVNKVFLQRYIKGAYITIASFWAGDVAGV
jgi:hypothetical protein